MGVKYKGRSIGWRAKSIPPGMPEQLEEILFPEAGQDIFDGTEPEYKDVMEALDDVVAKALEAVANRVAPVLRTEVVDRIAEIATDEEMKVLKYWQGRVTPNKDAVIEGIREFELLPGFGEDVAQWWLYTFSRRKGGWDPDRSNVYYLIHAWRRECDNASPSGIVIRDLYAKTLASFISHIPSVAQIAQYETDNLESSEGDAAVGLTTICQTYVDITRFAMLLAEKVLELPNTIHCLTIHEVEQEVIGADIPYKRDCGPIGSVAQMRQVIEETTGVVAPCDNRCNNWVASHRGYSNNCPYHQPGYGDFRRTVSPAANSMSEAEKAVFRSLAPRVYEWGHEAMVMRLALMNNTTPSHIRICLNSTQTGCPSTECDSNCANALVPRERCPFADTCQTDCGYLQRNGRAFPITDDGTFESCRVHFFLTAIEGMDTEARQTLAEQHIEMFKRQLEAREKAAERAAKKAATASKPKKPRAKAVMDVTQPDELKETAQVALF